MSYSDDYLVDFDVLCGDLKVVLLFVEEFCKRRGIRVVFVDDDFKCEVNNLYKRRAVRVCLFGDDVDDEDVFRVKVRSCYCGFVSFRFCDFCGCDVDDDYMCNVVLSIGDRLFFERVEEVLVKVLVGKSGGDGFRGKNVS